MAAEHQAARGVAIETMRERGRSWQAEAERAEIIFEAFAALRPLVNGQACRLVDHQHQAVAIDEPSHYLFRGHGHLPRFAETAITTGPPANPKNMNDQSQEKQSWCHRLSGRPKPHPPA